MPEYRGTLDGRPLRVAIAVSRFNESVTRGLLEGARAALAECRVAPDAIDVVHVPGALELPVVARELAASGRYDALLVLGAVIRGETDHYLHVCTETARGCTAAALETGVPVGFGVLTCETLAQARDRSTTPAKNQGAEAARAAVETATLLALLREADGEGGAPSGAGRGGAASRGAGR
ncbi:MAG TPA: 6,7-dimethyl-8-ribityllumazine synthase [Planctomycetota bacterium]|nr:6,7-dimethyl-8-ribityllumazine synthase [Planctomycetota bacterium]